MHLGRFGHSNARGRSGTGLGSTQVFSKGGEAAIAAGRRQFRERIGEEFDELGIGGGLWLALGEGQAVLEGVNSSLIFASWRSRLWG
jgi:hypothetical protein